VCCAFYASDGGGWLFPVLFSVAALCAVTASLFRRKGLLKKSETCRWLGDKPTACSALQGDGNNANGAFPAFPKLPTTLNLKRKPSFAPRLRNYPRRRSFREARRVRRANGRKNLGANTTQNNRNTLIFNVVGSFSGGLRKGIPPIPFFTLFGLAWAVFRGGGEGALVEAVLFAGLGFLAAGRPVFDAVFLAVCSMALLVGASKEGSGGPPWPLAAVSASAVWWMLARERAGRPGSAARRSARRASAVSAAWQLVFLAVCAGALWFPFERLASSVRAVSAGGPPSDTAAPVGSTVFVWRVFEALWNGVASAASALAGFLFSPWGAALGVCAVLALAAYLSRDMFAAFLAGISAKRRGERYLSMAGEASDPGERVRLCYMAARAFLEAAGHPRRSNAELFDYAASLEEISPEARKDAMVVFLLYSKLVYGRLGVIKRDSDEALRRAGSLAMLAK